ncbi:hypothetical protein AHIS1636_27380 [Arthrobacter mangrovi]|uniref:Polysaccharide pyruvyl transferase domain-containing protein n=2 Tax=Arthrobacter mangrovi TaxID=2966350 RepID=A0ABQ5MWC9_9MICC|nr:hypothetical protein AHIS1636_27380 [Arthrobacter mangrovi]
MLEAYLENTSGEVVVVVRDESDIQVPDAEKDRTRVAELPNLIYGSPSVAHFREISLFASLASTATEVAVVGADIMDGAYNPKASARRANMLRLANRMGADSKVLGFSWNGRPTTASRQFLKRATLAGTQLYVRDPISASRARGDGLSNVVETADMVFSATKMSEIVADKIVGNLSGQKIALVNISAHIEQSVPQIEDYVELTNGLISQGFNVFVIPHVSRTTSDDIELSRVLVDRVKSPQVELVDELLEPAAIRSLAHRASIVVSGRMHLSIIALSQGVPAVVLDSQGKVKGLEILFPEHFACIEPRAGFAFVALEAALRLHPRSVPVEHLSAVQRKSLTQFQPVCAAGAGNE